MSFLLPSALQDFRPASTLHISFPVSNGLQISIGLERCCGWCLAHTPQYQLLGDLQTFGTATAAIAAAAEPALQLAAAASEANETGDSSPADTSSPQLSVACLPINAGPPAGSGRERRK